MPPGAVTLAGDAMVRAPSRARSPTSRAPVQLVQLWQGTPGRKLGPMHDSRVSRNAKVSPTASPLAFSLAEPPVLLSSPCPHSCRNTAAISPVLEQPPPER